MSRSILSAKGWALPSGPSGEESILQEWASFSWLSMDSAQVENWEYCKWFLPVDVSDSCSVEKITPNMTLFLLVALSVRCFAQAFSSGGECRLLSGCGASHCSGFSCCRTQALGAWASVVVAHRLTHSLACGVFLDQGSKLCPLHWQAYSYPLHHQGSPQPLFLFSFTSPVAPFNTLFLFMVCIVPTAFHILFILFLFL